MVARIRSGKSLKGAINYNEKKVKEGQAELILAKGYPKQERDLNFHEKLGRLQKLADLNTRAETHCLHVSLNFDPTEQLSSDKFKAIAERYMQGIGFGDQPFLVYQHHDASHPHIHIVSTNIKKDGKRISLHNLGRVQSEKIRKEIEISFGLVKASDRQQKQLQPLKPIKIEKAVYGKSETKRTISNIVTQVIAQYKFASLPELNAVLMQYNVIADKGAEGTRMHEKGGLQYCLLDHKGNKVGIPIKASSIYESPTLKILAAKYERNKKAKDEHKDIVKKIIAVNLQHSRTRESFILQLKAGGIDAVLRRNEQNFIYGVTYVDHKSKCVFNGSDLGKEFSAAMIRDKWEHKGGGGGSVKERVLPEKSRGNISEPSTDKSKDNILDEVTGSSSGFNNQLPYPFRKKRKRKNRKL
jgi:hypothetical protein